MTTVQVLEALEHALAPEPDQPVRLLPALAVAVSAMLVLVLGLAASPKLAVHPPLALGCVAQTVMPAGALLTVPVPVPLVVTVNSEGVRTRCAAPIWQPLPLVGRATPRWSVFGGLVTAVHR